MWNLDETTKRIFLINEKWWRDLATNEPIERDDGELFSLIASELSEAVEGERKNLDDDKLPQFKMAGVEMVDFVVRCQDFASRRGLVLFDHIEISRERFPWVNITPESNRLAVIWKMHRRLALTFDMPKVAQQASFSFLIADARLYCETFGYPFDEAYEAKVAYNETRLDHTHTERAKPNGKKK